MKLIIIAFLFFSVGSRHQLLGQRLSVAKSWELELSDSLTVKLWQSKVNGLYYYQPCNLRLSKKNNEPEFSFLQYRNESGSVSGGIMHFLLTWGLTVAQETATATFIREKDSLAVLAAAIPLYPLADFFLTEHTELGDMLVDALRSQVKPPLMPGSKMALSFQFKSHQATRLAEIFHTPRVLQQDSVHMVLYPQDSNLQPVQLSNSWYDLLTEALQQLNQ